jgi:hypothetical protein
MKQLKNPDVDVIMNILDAALLAFPNAVFIKSLHFQYQERGGLSKKQLEGLHSKASKATTINVAKLATLEAIIKKMPTKYKSDKPLPPAPIAKDELTPMMIEQILAVYPQHKRVLFYKVKYANNEAFSLLEKTELEKFYTLLIKK